MNERPHSENELDARVQSALASIHAKPRKRTRVAEHIERNLAHILKARDRHQRTWDEIAETLTDAGLPTSASYLRSVILRLAKSQSANSHSVSTTKRKRVRQAKQEIARNTDQHTLINQTNNASQQTKQANAGSIRTQF